MKQIKHKPMKNWKCIAANSCLLSEHFISWDYTVTLGPYAFHLVHLPHCFQLLMLHLAIRQRVMQSDTYSNKTGSTNRTKHCWEGKHKMQKPACSPNLTSKTLVSSMWGQISEAVAEVTLFLSKGVCVQHCKIHLHSSSAQPYVPVAVCA